ncbi:leucine-rich repeat domain-containing protein [Scytonema hofmannii FACHB-248]|uniref:non-specific serine/threonine protein kinase n=1 Tax=Scytonema hofmannii FACHB-248 TaxID=1842502 RepID=A0ABR8GIQ9_9CYAN|nr:leucine-rich repeat domain-containing protein [Scytonema hofmannii]MBD2603251.1 leucine-rich repeat domain-containing protein [Scytonema hofmannii FACHB-248]
MTEKELLQLIEQAATEGATELDLSGKDLTALPASIGKLTQLKKLILGKYKYDQDGDIVGTIGNNLSVLPAEIGLLNHLEVLQVIDNNLTSLPQEFGQLTNLQSLDLSSNQLSSLPQEFGQLTNLQSLDLSFNQLSSLPQEFGQLTNLQSLNLYYNELSSLPQEFVQLTNLQSLNLSFNQLSSLPQEIVQLTNLQSLDFTRNQLSSLPQEIVQLTNLQSLDLSFNQLSSLPQEIVQLTNLQTLDFTRNQLSSLPQEIVQLTNLQTLDLRYNELSSLPPEIVQLTNLQTLDLRYNELSSLPPEIVQLTNLQTLNLNRNKLSNLPPEIVQLTNLQSLNLSDNQLSNLPPEIGQLTNLQSLNLNRNKLSSLPQEIVQLTNLQSLNLSRNKLSNLPPEIGQLTNLQSLNLSDNQLSSLPQEIVQLTNLQSLNLSDNQLSSLPQEIVQLTNLQTLNLSDNKLSSLPEEFGQLTNLQSLDLSDNQLSSLPEEFGQLTNLQSLDLSDNQLSSLPEEFGQLQKLEYLDLRRNPIPIPPEILGAKDLSKNPGDVSEILDFYFRVQDPNETELIYEAKFLIIGEGGAGKTSLAKKIENESYKLQSDEKSTEGIEVIRWDFTLPNGKDFRVNIWDFGGQEIYHQTHQFFLTERSLYALVADNRKENTDFYWWLKVVELLSDKSPVLIIKNEKQDRECEISERSLRGEFTNLKEVLATNLDTNRGLSEIKDAIQLYISNLPHINIPLPKVWVRVRSALENDSRNYINVEEYCQLCRVNHLTDRKDMLRLSRYLHDLGVCLHFQDDPTLKHYIILKPEWGTTAVYKVLDNKTVRQNLGRFTKENLSDIWQDSEYADMQDELLQLMIRFKLCYPIPYSAGNYIAPQLLDINQPDYIWEKSHNLILRYKYDFMPKGMLTRFIVETHPWIEQQNLVWKSGVVLNKDQTRVEVIEDYNQKEIKIRVAGNRKKELLAVVTHELDKIHNSFERLQYNTLVPCNCKDCEGSLTPYSYPLDNLYKRLKAGRYQIECEESYESVDVRRLIDDVNLQPVEAEQKLNSPTSPLQDELSKAKDNSLKNQTTMNYHDFQILVNKDNKIRASSEQGDESGELRLEMNRIKQTLKLIEHQVKDADLLKGLGNELYQALFPPKIHGQLRATIAGAQANGYAVRLRLVFDSPELAALPWEFLYDEATNTFLANNTQTALSRYIDVPLQKRDLQTATLPLKILLVISSPTDMRPLDVDTEAKLIREALEKHIDAGLIELDVLEAATIRNIDQKLCEKAYNVFHFIGHGIFENNKGFIALVDNNGKAKLLDDENFANFFLGNQKVGLAVLNSCEGTGMSDQQVFAGIAPNLVRRGIPAVVAMQYPIFDRTAKLFADKFYRTLALGYPVDAAIQTTRNAISMEIGLDKPDFATPVLYMRAKDGIILNGLKSI